MAVIVSRGIVAPDRITYVRWLQSSGTQFFDTGFTPNNNTRVVMDIEILQTTTSTCAMFGARTSFDSNNYAFILVNGVLRSDYNKDYTQTWSVTITTRRVIDKNKETTTVDGTAKSYTNSSFQAPGNLYLLALNNNNKSAQWYTSAKLYSCQIYDDGTLVRDFWPCYDPDGVACLYDKVENKYYYNVGSGEFIAGEAA